MKIVKHASNYVTATITVFRDWNNNIVHVLCMYKVANYNVKVILKKNKIFIVNNQIHDIISVLDRAGWPVKFNRILTG